MAIVVLVFWLFTAGAGFYLLVTSSLGRARPNELADPTAPTGSAPVTPEAPTEPAHPAPTAHHAPAAPISGIRNAMPAAYLGGSRSAVSANTV